MASWERLIKARKEKGYTQAYMAAKCGISQGSYLRWENMTYSPNIKQLRVLSAVLEVPLDWLCYNDDYVFADRDFWREKAILDQKYRALMAKYSGASLKKTEALEQAAASMGLEASYFAGVKIDEERTDEDPFGDLLVELEGKKNR